MTSSVHVIPELKIGSDLNVQRVGSGAISHAPPVTPRGGYSSAPTDLLARQAGVRRQLPACFARKGRTPGEDGAKKTTGRGKKKEEAVPQVQSDAGSDDFDGQDGDEDYVFNPADFPMLDGDDDLFGDYDEEGGEFGMEAWEGDEEEEQEGKVKAPADVAGDDGTGKRKARLPVVAVIGRPNVGKSTIVNRICRSLSTEPKAIVYDYEGVTRDRIYRRYAHWTRCLSLCRGRPCPSLPRPPLFNRGQRLNDPGLPPSLCFSCRAEWNERVFEVVDTGGLIFDENADDIFAPQIRDQVRTPPLSHLPPTVSPNTPHLPPLSSPDAPASPPPPCASCIPGAAGAGRVRGRGVRNGRADGAHHARRGDRPLPPHQAQARGGGREQVRVPHHERGLGGHVLLPGPGPPLCRQWPAWHGHCRGARGDQAAHLPGDCPTATDPLTD